MGLCCETLHLTVWNFSGERPSNLPTMGLCCETLHLTVRNVYGERHLTSPQLGLCCKTLYLTVKSFYGLRIFSRHCNGDLTPYPPTKSTVVDARRRRILSSLITTPESKVNFLPAYWAPKVTVSVKVAAFWRKRKSLFWTTGHADGTARLLDWTLTWRPMCAFICLLQTILKLWFLT